MSYITTNIGLETNLFEAALAQDAKPRFLIISSGTLYDPKAPLPMTEASATIPNSPYAVSKIGQEQMARYYGLRGFTCMKSEDQREEQCPLPRAPAKLTTGLLAASAASHADLGPKPSPGGGPCCGAFFPTRSTRGRGARMNPMPSYFLPSCPDDGRVPPAHSNRKMRAR